MRRGSATVPPRCGWTARREETRMSKHELFDAYIARAINRRTFVQGLIALGIPAGVAASYAVALQPAAARGRALHDDYYCDDPHDYYDDPHDYYDDHPGTDTP